MYIVNIIIYYRWVYTVPKIYIKNEKKSIEIFDRNSSKSILGIYNEIVEFELYCLIRMKT